MSKRDVSLYIDDILESIEAIQEYVDDMDYESFFHDRKTYAATIREFIVIGEAIAKIIDIVEEVYEEYPWRTLKDFRNFIVHEYFGVNPQIIYDAATLELDELKEKISELKYKV